MRLLRQRHAREVDVEHLAADRIAADVVDERGYLAAGEPGERKERRVPPAAVRELERVEVRVDRRRVGAAPEKDAGKDAPAAKGVHFLTEHRARANGQLLRFSHGGTLPSGTRAEPKLSLKPRLPRSGRQAESASLGRSREIQNDAVGA